MSKKTYSIIECHSKQEGNSCGYCHSPDTNNSHGMTPYQLTVTHYQNLIDRGWRRSGCYCYKPTMQTTCCPSYTIKCKALDFQISKSQKKILKRVIKFLKNELPKEEQKASRNKYQPDIVRSMEISHCSDYAERIEKNSCKIQVTSVSEEVNSRLNSNVSNSESSTITQMPENSKSTIVQLTENNPKESSSKTFISNRAPQRKAKLLRIERKQNKLLAQGKTQEEITAIMNKRKHQNTSKSLEDFFNEINNCSNKLELRLIKTSSDSFKSSAKASFELFKKYQITIHNDKIAKLTEERFKRNFIKSPLQMKMVRVMSDQFLNTFEETAKLFKTYQMAIHNDKPKNCDKKSFFDFLVKSPLQEWKPSDGPPQGYGSFHEQYWLNGTLIAVAVIDILPLCVSSVYFFYDPEYSHLSLGTVSSLREVLLTRQLNKYAPNLKYYYMGYYIHTCPKMRYKAKIRPSELLCPETYVWCDINKCLPKLDVSKYSRLNEDLTAVDEDSVVDINQLFVLYQNQVTTYGLFREHFKNEPLDNLIKEYAPLIGKQCASSILFFID